MSAQTITGIGQEVATRIGIDPAARSAGTANGTGIDRTGFNSVLLVGQTGAETGSPTARTVDFKIQHSDVVGSGYVDFTPSIPNPGGTGALAQIAAVSTIKKRSIDLKTAKQFIRVFATTAFTGGTSPTLLSSATLVLGGADTLPIADDT